MAEQKTKTIKEIKAWCKTHGLKYDKDREEGVWWVELPSVNMDIIQSFTVGYFKEYMTAFIDWFEKYKGVSP